MSAQATPVTGNLPVVFTGSIDGTTKKPQLVAVCEALKIDTRDKDKKLHNKKTLLALVEEHLFGETSFAEDPRFAQLYEHRNAKKPAKGSKKKTSTEKTAEDLAEQAKGSQALTGANLKLHQKESTTDPQGAFAPLGLQPQAKVARAMRLRLALSSRKAKRERESRRRRLKETREAAAGRSLPQRSRAMLVHPALENYPTTQVFVGNVAINKTVAADGALHHETKLTTLVPAMLNSQSPMKSKGPRRETGATGLERTAVAQIVDGPQPDCLGWDRVNNLTLTESAEQAGEYECIMFFQPSATIAPSHAATSLTGAQTDRPLDIAKERAAAAPVAKKGDGPVFYKFLRDLVGEPKELALPKNTHAGKGLDSYLKFDAYFRKFAPYSKNKGAGYHLPLGTSASTQCLDFLTRVFTAFTPPEGVTLENLEQFLGVDWTKAEVIFSGGLKKSATNDNHVLLTKAMRLNTDAGEYIRKGRRNEDDARVRELEVQFDDMDYGVFKALLESELEDLEDTKPGPSKRKPKRARTPDSDSEDEEEKKKREKRARILEKEAKKLRDKGKKKAAAKSKSAKGKEKAFDSDDLDSDVAPKTK
ncbi:hypothetical protein B0H16DRAFT_1450663 [Mycena metata]|uniref:Uncharacterized protein n=1 Tax=Mycena metata TaxID=1033252 RepID=A0AAD7JXC2_9AGAR|nr:hypothetical protein B0H16DRAFT_1450663 [Mycena metata]